MAEYKISNYERETTITYNDAEKVSVVYTLNTALIRKMDKLISEHPDEIILDKEDDISKTYIVPKKWIKISPPKILNLTDEQRKACGDRLKKAKKASK